jgi:hypothetical protein
MDIPSMEGVNQKYAQGAEEINKSAEDYMKQAQEHADFAVKNHYDAQLTLMSSNILAKAKDYEGTNAFEAADPAVKTFDENVKSLRSGVTDQRQQQALDNLSAEHRARLIDDIGKHVATETPRIDAEKFMVQRASKLHDIGVNYNDPNTVQRNINDMYKASDEAARINHWTPEAIQKDRQAIHEGVLDTVSTQKSLNNQAYQIPNDLKDARDSGKISEVQFKELTKKYDSDVSYSQAYQEFYGDKNEGIKGIYDNKSKRFFDESGNVKPQELWNYVRNHERFKGDEDHAQSVYNDMWRFAKIQEGKNIGDKADQFRAWENFVITQKNNGKTYDDTIKHIHEFGGIGDPVDINDRIKIAAGSFAPPDIKENPEYKVKFKIGIKKADDDSVYLKANQLEKDKENGVISVKDYSDCLEYANSKLNGGIDKEKELMVDSVDGMMKNKFGEGTEKYYQYRDTLDGYLKDKNVNIEDIRDWSRKNLFEEPGSDKKTNPEFFKKLSDAMMRATPINGEPAKFPAYKVPLNEEEEKTRNAKRISNLVTQIGPNAQDIVSNMAHSNNYRDLDTINSALEPYLSKPNGVETINNAVEFLKSIPPNENGKVPITVENIESAIQGGYTIQKNSPEYSESITTPGSKRLKVNKTKVE